MRELLFFSRFTQEKMYNELCFCGQVDERREMGNFIGIGNDYTQLKKRGLCLVPLSMVVNYLAE